MSNPCEYALAAASVERLNTGARGSGGSDISILLWQVYALEKVLEVTSTICAASDVRPRVHLVELTGVNELPQAHRLVPL